MRCAISDVVAAATATLMLAIAALGFSAGCDGSLPASQSEPSHPGEAARLRAHFAAVDAELRAADTSQLTPPQRDARAAAIERLRDYAARGVFPHNHDRAARTPVFVDRHGTRCAMAHLIEQADERRARRAHSRDAQPGLHSRARGGGFVGRTRARRVARSQRAHRCRIRAHPAGVRRLRLQRLHEHRRSTLRGCEPRPRRRRRNDDRIQPSPRRRQRRRRHRSRRRRNHDARRLQSRRRLRRTERSPARPRLDRRRHRRDHRRRVVTHIGARRPPAAVVERVGNRAGNRTDARYLRARLLLIRTRALNGCCRDRGPSCRACSACVRRRLTIRRAWNRRGYHDHRRGYHDHHRAPRDPPLFHLHAR
jgi:hypothetical protein